MITLPKQLGSTEEETKEIKDAQKEDVDKKHVRSDQVYLIHGRDDDKC